jgi:hypothetical protein
MESATGRAAFGYATPTSCAERILVALQGKTRADFVPRTCPQKARLAGRAVASPLEHGV